jgi:hypothetical protein
LNTREIFFSALGVIVISGVLFLTLSKEYSRKTLPQTKEFKNEQGQTVLIAYSYSRREEMIEKWTKENKDKKIISISFFESANVIVFEPINSVSK